MSASFTPLLTALGSLGFEGVTPTQPTFSALFESLDQGGGVTPAEHPTLLELALRSLVLAHLRAPAPAAPPQVHPFVDNVVDFSIRAACEGVLEGASVFAVLEDVFEASPVGAVESIWHVVDERRDHLFPLVQGPASQRARLALLRVSSGLLRRLSRMADTVMCGKVLLFLAFILPLSERSGVNVTGGFNTDNVTDFEGGGGDLEEVIEPAAAWRGAPAKAPAPAPVPRGRGAPATAVAAAAASSASSTTAHTPTPPANDPPFTLGGRFHIPAVAASVGEAYRAAAQGTAPSSPAFYRAFWRMQYLMTHPATVLATSDTWALYVCSMRAVLRAFEREDEESGVAVSLGGQGVGSSSNTNPALPPSYAHQQQLASTAAARLPHNTSSSSAAAFVGGAPSQPHHHTAHQPSHPSFSKPMAVEEGEEGEEVAPGALKGRLATATTAALPPPPPLVKPGGGAPAPPVSAAATALAAAKSAALAKVPPPSTSTARPSLPASAPSTAAAAAAPKVALLIPSLGPVTRSPLDAPESWRGMSGGGGGSGGSNSTQPFSSSSSSSSSSSLMVSSGGQSDSLFGGKYLTSPTLLTLELKDSSLRRHIILQYLISMQYFILPRKGDPVVAAAMAPPSAVSGAAGGGGKPGAASPPASAAAAAAAAAAAHQALTLHPTPVTIARDLAPLRDLCYALLRRSPPQGPLFVRAIASLLAREAHFHKWKQAGAHPFEKALPTPLSPSSEHPPPPSKRPRTGALPHANSLTSQPIKRPFQWASAGLNEDLLAVCADPARAVRPTLAAHLVPLRIAIDPRNGIEDEYSPAKDNLFVWRGLRLLAEEKLEAFFAIAVGKSTFTEAVIEAFDIVLPPPPSPPPMEEGAGEGGLEGEAKGGEETRGEGSAPAPSAESAGVMAEEK